MLWICYFNLVYSSLQLWPLESRSSHLPSTKRSNRLFPARIVGGYSLLKTSSIWPAALIRHVLHRPGVSALGLFLCLNYSILSFSVLLFNSLLTGSFGSYLIPINAEAFAFTSLVIEGCFEAMTSFRAFSFPPLLKMVIAEEPWWKCHCIWWTIITALYWAIGNCRYSGWIVSCTGTLHTTNPHTLRFCQ